ncbi:hypothetical protein [Calidifontibacter indicus]|uniref:hypothetical protein n=1 Tax=Calidifontibacter indicus TaxID=419650 RepID=UPI003D73BD79
MHPRTSPRTRLARTTSLLVAFCVAVLGLWLPSAPSAKGAGTVTISIDPAASSLTADSTGAEVVGTITNDSGHAIGNGTVHVGVAGTVLDTANALQRWAQGQSGISTPTVASASIGAVPDGTARPFRVQIPAAKLPWKYQLAALPMTVTLTEGGSITSAATLQQVRTTLQMQTGAVTAPLRIGWVVPLTLPADPALFGPGGTARDEAWNRAIGSGSRVQQLIDSLAGQQVTWLIDPMLLDPPVGADDNVPAARIEDPATSTEPAPSPSTSESTSGSSTGSTSSSTTGTTPSSGTSSSTSAPSSTSPSTTTSPTDSTSPSDTATSSTTSETTDGGDGTSDQIPSDTVGVLVTELLSKLRSLGTGQQVWWTAYDDPDVTTLLDRDRALLQRDLSRPLPPALSAISTTRAVWPSGEVGATDLSRITAAWTSAGQQAPVVVLPRRAASTTGTATTNGIARVSGTAGAVLYDERLSSIAAAGDDPGVASSRLLAESIAIYQQSPGAQRSISIAIGRDSTATPQALAATVKAVSAAGWMSTLNHDAARATAPAVSLLPTPAKGTPYPQASTSALTPGLLQSLNRQRQRVETIGSILVDSDDVVRARQRALDVVGSTRWRGNAAALRTVSNTNRTALNALSEKVNVNPSTVNFFADSGRLAVTVINDLNRPVHDVQLRLQPRRYLLRIEKQPEPISLRANSRSSVRTEVTAISPGEVAVDARLFAPGDVPLGGPDVATQLTVNVRPTSTWIYWVLGIVGGLVLVVGLMRSLRRGPRRTTVGPDDAGPTPADAIVAAAPAREADRPEDDSEDDPAATGAQDSPTTKASPPDDEQP